VVGGRGEADLRALAATPNIEVRISRVPEWSGGYVPFSRVEHCKYMVTDNEWLWLGTSNWDPSYFLSSRNIGVTMQHRKLAAQVRAIFETSWRMPSAVALAEGVTLEKRIHAETPPPERCSTASERGCDTARHECCEFTDSSLDAIRVGACRGPGLPLPGRRSAPRFRAAARKCAIARALSSEGDSGAARARTAAEKAHAMLVLAPATDPSRGVSNGQHEPLPSLE
jgi:hypothetical protein